MPPFVELISPWEFSPLIAVTFSAATLAYANGMRATWRGGGRTGFWKPLSFFLGLGLCYVVMQTYYDYLAQHMFWVHRLQHLVLHHVGPLLIVLSAPHVLIPRGLPRGLRERVLEPVARNPVNRLAWRALQNPIVAPVLFVGLIAFWLVPDVHFDAMISARRYWLMNGSMFVDGLLFWWLMLDPRPPLRGRTLRHGVRCLVLMLVMFPQIAIGAYIALHRTTLYDVYAVCGRAWLIDPMVDQRWGGLITWIPASMMSVVAGLVVLRQWLHANDPRREAPASAPTRTGLAGGGVAG